MGSFHRKGEGIVHTHGKSGLRLPVLCKAHPASHGDTAAAVFLHGGGKTLWECAVHGFQFAENGGGKLFSADFPGFFRRTLEKTIDNVKAMFINGCEGDLNHVNFYAENGELNHLSFDFADGPRGYGHSRHMGYSLTGAVLQVYEKVNYTDVDSLRFARRVVHMPSNMPTPEEMPLARKYYELHKEGRDDEIPFKGMELTTVIADSNRKVRLENGPEFFDLTISGLAVGKVALVGYPAEPFNAVGEGVKDTEGWDMIMPSCMTNGREGYFPTKDAYDEGGYEAKTSNYKAGAAEQLIVEGKALLDTLR